MELDARNEIFLENEGMIRRTIRRNRLLIRALGMDLDDVYQELALAELKAIDGFDPSRSESIRGHIWVQLQYAVLDMKRRQRPHGLTGLGEQRPVVLSFEYTAEAYPASEEPAIPELSPQLRQALSRLDPSEREAVIRYLNEQEAGKDPVLHSAFDKIRDSYCPGTHAVMVWG